MSNALLKKTEQEIQNLHLHSFNPEISLVGKPVFIKKCKAQDHRAGDQRCVCHLIRTWATIIGEHKHPDGTSSFEIFESGRIFFLERGEFLPQEQFKLLSRRKIYLIT